MKKTLTPAQRESELLLKLLNGPPPKQMKSPFRKIFRNGRTKAASLRKG